LFIAHQSQCGLTSVYCVLIIFVECLCDIKYISAFFWVRVNVYKWKNCSL
jgi:hypothetical protein